MSNTQYVFLRKVAVPDLHALQNAVDSLGFDLKLYPALDLLSDSGFSPCVLNGISDIGFELTTGVPADVFGDAGALGGTNDFCIAMTWRSSMLDCAAAMIVTCALIKGFGAIASFEGEAPLSLAPLLNEIESIIQEGMHATARHRGKRVQEASKQFHRVSAPSSVAPSENAEGGVGFLQWLAKVVGLGTLFRRNHMAQEPIRPAAVPPWANNYADQLAALPEKERSLFLARRRLQSISSSLDARERVEIEKEVYDWLTRAQACGALPKREQKMLEAYKRRLGGAQQGHAGDARNARA